ncbi:MAG: dihydroorotate dehydrogenase [Candidatus Omnitrophota bacterium]|nr:dihydroorotate dehydrogenase [Candidatus Omnitrophota bacterium]
MKLSVNIGKLKLKNPVMVASGTFGYGEEFGELVHLKKLGAIITKTITLDQRQGNPAPRTCETPAGMLNAIGLENPGIENFIKEQLPFFNKIGPPIIASIAAETPEELKEIINLLNDTDVTAIELNLSCPNVKSPQCPAVHRPQRGHKNSLLVAQDAQATYNWVRAACKVTKKILIVKLSPNVTDIAEIAIAAQAAGADTVSLINTVSAMSVDIETRRPKLANISGGLSGPAIRPIAVRMVWEAYQKIKIPIIGTGGIMDLQSALEFFIAGATAVSIGTANFINPRASIEIIDGLKGYLVKNKIGSINKLTGSIKCRI